MEVYQRLVAEDPRTAPDLLISGMSSTREQKISLSRLNAVVLPLFLTLRMNGSRSSGDTVVIFYPCTSVEIADDASTIASGTALARLNISNDSDRETQDFGKGHNKGKGKQVPSGCKGRKGVTAKILEKPKDKDEQVSSFGRSCDHRLYNSALTAASASTKPL